MRNLKYFENEGYQWFQDIYVNIYVQIMSKKISLRPLNFKNTQKNN